jgi:Flavoprotein
MQIALVVTGAPLATHTRRILDTLTGQGHHATICPTTAALDWIGDTAGLPLLQARIRPDTVICCPATFNTLNAWAAGINNTAPLGILNDALGLHSRILAVPMIAERLTAHPAWPRTLHTLTGARVELMDPHTGQITPQPRGIVSGTGDTVADDFDPAWLQAWLTTITPADADR